MLHTQNTSQSPFGVGIYALSEVAKYTKASSDTIRYWFLGHSDRPEPILSRASVKQQADITVTFHDLIDAYVVARFREHGVTLQYLRKVYDALAKEFGQSHPFSRKDFYTDGHKVFVSYFEESAGEILKELLTNQQGFPKILKQFLTQVDYDKSTSLATRWHIHEGIVIDPARRFGKPIVETCGVPTGILATAYGANGRDTHIVADWYEINVVDVARAVAFENSLSRAA
jgi:uncharacterized protein (DUF433 family)